MSNDHPTARYRSGHGALFSSTKCPPGPDLSSQCDLPFGVVWNPFAPPEPAMADVEVHNHYDEALPPVLCLACLSYLHLFAQIRDSDDTWGCELCGARNVAPPPLPVPVPSPSPSSRRGRFREVRSPAVEYRQRLPPSAVSTTGGGSSSSTPFLASPSPAGAVPEADGDRNSMTLVIVVDEHVPRADAQAVAAALQQHVSSASMSTKQPTRVGLVVYGRSVTIYELGISSGIAVGDVYTSHRALDENRLRTRAYLQDVESNQLHSLMRCLSSVYGFVIHDSTPLPSSRDAEENRDRPLSRLEVLKRRKEERILRQQQQQQNPPTRSPWELRKEQQKATRPAFRCVGEALQVAIDLATAGANPSRTSRILLFTNGCPSFGDGSVVASATGSGAGSSQPPSRRTADVVDPLQLQRSVEYFRLLGKAACEVGVAIDVFCCGAMELALPAYHAMVEASSGYVLSSLTFSEPQFAYNMLHVLQQNFVAGLHGTALRDDNWIDGCIVDVRMPSFFTVTHIVGPGQLIDGSRHMLVNERSGFAVGASLAAAKKIPTNNLPVGDMVESTLTRVRLGRFDPLSTVSLMLRLNDFYQHESHALFQFVARYVDRDGATLVTRVYTHRLAVAKDTVDFLDGVDEEVVPVLLAKEAVSRSMLGRELPSADDNDDGAGGVAVDALELENLAVQAQKDLDATIQRVSGAFRLLSLEKGATMRGMDLTEEGGVKATGSSLDFAFPPELADALQRLYHFRRGPLLSPGPMQSDDDRAAIRSLFMRLPLDDCLSMMALSLWSSGPLSAADMPSMMSVPPDTLALWDNCVLAGDHYYVLFIWSGRATLDPQFDEVREQLKDFLLDRSRNRFPLPVLHMLKEDDSMSRRFTALLSPSHFDPVDHQLSNFPALGQLSMEELAALQSKFKFYDPETDASFRSWFWSVASASSTCKDEGVSLCE